MKEFKIIMQSEAFGREEFGPYDSWEEACEAIWNLREKATEAFEDDGVERIIGFVVGEEE